MADVDTNEASLLEDPGPGLWRVAGVELLADEAVFVLHHGRPSEPPLRSPELVAVVGVVAPAGWVPAAAHFSGAPLPEGAWSGVGVVRIDAPPSEAEEVHRRAVLTRFPQLATSRRAGVAAVGTRSDAAEVEVVDQLRTRARVEVRIHGEGSLRAVSELAQAVRERGGRALVVGGSVRDALWDHHHGTLTPIKDVDIEVFGVPAAELHAMVLRAHPSTKLVGAQFGVLKVEALGLDVSLPRRERKTGVNHKDFDVDTDPFMTVEEAAERRDFTVNAVSWDPLSGEVVDPVGGAADLRARLLRHVGPRFAEDALRVLRGAQFVGRFGLVTDPDTERLCRSLLPEAAELSSERVWEEVGKLLLKGHAPGAGLWFLERVGWVDVVSPQLAALRGVAQDEQWHPEGDVWTHTCHVLDFWSAHLRTGDPYEDLVVALACLAHDFGKASTTAFVDGRWRAHGHEEAGIEPTRQWLADAQFGDVDGVRRSRLIDDVVPLVASHLAPVQFFESQPGDRAVRRLAQRVGRIDRLVRVSHADQGGRPPLDNRDFPAGEWLLERAAALDVVASKPEPLLRGQDLIDALGLKPGPHFRALLDAALEAQFDGDIATRDEAVTWIRRRLDAAGN